MTRGGSRRGKAATGRRAGAARPRQCSRHCDACMDWPSPLPTSCKRGSPALRGLLGHTASRLCQRELLQPLLPQPVPGQVLAGHHSHHLPGKGQGTAQRGHTEPGDSVSLCPLEEPVPAWTQQGLTSLRLSTTTKCLRPRARKSLNTRGRDASCKAQQGWGGAAAPPASPHCPP